MNHQKELSDLDFAYKIRRALNESAENLSVPTLERLANARKIALIRRKQVQPSAISMFSGVFAGGSGFTFKGPGSWLGKFGVMLPMLVLVIGLFGIHEYEQQQRISDLAELDVAVLVDELPPDAYLDTGFSTFLSQSEE